MNLTEVIENLERLDADQTIYVETPSPDVEAVVDYETDDGDAPVSAKGLSYLFEVLLARDAIRVWSEWRDGRQPTVDEKIESIIYYSEKDTFLPTL